MARGGSFIVVINVLCHLATTVISNRQDVLSYKDIDLPPSHVKYYFNSYPKIADECRNDTSCPYKVSNSYLSSYFTHIYDSFNMILLLILR